MSLGLEVFDEMLTRPSASWREADSPMALRGVSCAWLIDFVSRVQREINGTSPEPSSFFSPSPPTSSPNAPYQLLNTHALVEHIIKPLTAELKAPLYCFVPERYRGRPQTFISHTWSSLLVGPQRQRIGSLDTLGASRDDEFIWIDFVCYNQHLFESIALDMSHLVSQVGSLSIVATPMPLFTRSWCLWELQSAYRAGARVDVRVESGWRNDKILSVNSLYRSFAGVAKARSQSQTDQADIYRGFIELFGSEERADASIIELIKDQFSRPWFELQHEGEALAFSAQPFSWGETSTEAHGTPFFLPDLLDAQIFGQSGSIRDYFQSLDVLPAQGAGDIVYDSRQTIAAHSDAEVAAANAALRASGEGGHVEARTVDVKVVTAADAGERSSPNDTVVRMACPGCGAEVEIASRPIYTQSSDPASPWAKFLMGQDATSCVCGVNFGGVPSLFCAETWTAVTLEPPPGRALHAEQFAVLIKQVLRDRDVYPLLVFERIEHLRAALMRGAQSEFDTIPYISLIFGDYAQPVETLSLAALDLSCSEFERDDLGYLILRNACCQSRAFFFWSEPVMRMLAQMWDAQGRATDLVKAGSLMLNLDELSHALMGDLPRLEFDKTYFCTPAARGTDPDATILGSRARFGANLEFASGPIGSQKCVIPPSVVRVPNPDIITVSKLYIELIGANEYLRHSRIELPKKRRERIQDAARRLEKTWVSLGPNNWAQLEAHYKTKGLHDLFGAVLRAL